MDKKRPKLILRQDRCFFCGNTCQNQIEGVIKCQHKKGNSIYILKGETLPIEVEVFGVDGLPLSGISVTKFALKKGTVITTKDAIIETGTVSTEMSQAETLLMEGVYKYEFRTKDGSGDVDSIVTGTIQVDPAIISVAI